MATNLKLNGWIRNLEDGRVEFLVAGPEKGVEEMIAWAKKGPPQARVEAVEIIEVNDHIPKEPFYINRAGTK